MGHRPEISLEIEYRPDHPPVLSVGMECFGSDGARKRSTFANGGQIWTVCEKLRNPTSTGDSGVYLFFPIQRPSSGGVDCGGLRACVACSKP